MQLEIEDSPERNSRTASARRKKLTTGKTEAKLAEETEPTKRRTFQRNATPATAKPKEK